MIVSKPQVIFETFEIEQKLDHIDFDILEKSIFLSSTDGIFRISEF